MLTVTNRNAKKKKNLLYTPHANNYTNERRRDARGERVVSANWISGVLNADYQKRRGDRRRRPPLLTSRTPPPPPPPPIATSTVTGATTATRRAPRVPAAAAAAADYRRHR